MITETAISFFSSPQGGIRSLPDLKGRFAPPLWSLWLRVFFRETSHSLGDRDPGAIEALPKTRFNSESEPDLLGGLYLPPMPC